MKRRTEGLLNGLIGVIIFSGSLPATRVAVQAFSPTFLTSARAMIAAVLASVLLYVQRQKPPSRSDLISLAIVAIGVVVGFPLLTAIALQYVNSAHSIVYIGLLPLFFGLSLASLLLGEPIAWTMIASTTGALRCGREAILLIELPALAGRSAGGEGGIACTGRSVLT